VEARAPEDVAIGDQRVVSRRTDDGAADQERHQHREDGYDDAAASLLERDPRREGARRCGLLGRDGRDVLRVLVHYAAALRLPPSISSPICSSETSPVCSPTICPSYRTRIRSESEKISSSSREMSRIARPSPRSSTRRRCRYSIAPTSRPRVGCAATSTFGSRA